MKYLLLLVAFLIAQHASSSDSVYFRGFDRPDLIKQQFINFDIDSVDDVMLWYMNELLTRPTIEDDIKSIVSLNYLLYFISLDFPAEISAKDSALVKRITRFIPFFVQYCLLSQKDETASFGKNNNDFMLNANVLGIAFGDESVVNKVMLNNMVHVHRRFAKSDPGSAGFITWHKFFSRFAAEYAAFHQIDVSVAQTSTLENPSRLQQALLHKDRDAYLQLYPAHALFMLPADKPKAARLSPILQLTEVAQGIDDAEDVLKLYAWHHALMTSIDENFVGRHFAEKIDHYLAVLNEPWHEDEILETHTTATTAHGCRPQIYFCGEIHTSRKGALRMLHFMKCEIERSQRPCIILKEGVEAGAILNIGFVTLKLISVATATALKGIGIIYDPILYAEAKFALRHELISVGKIESTLNAKTGETTQHIKGSENYFPYSKVLGWDSRDVNAATITQRNKSLAQQIAESIEHDNTLFIQAGYDHSPWTDVEVFVATLARFKYFGMEELTSRFELTLPSFQRESAAEVSTVLTKFFALKSENALAWMSKFPEFWPTNDIYQACKDRNIMFIKPQGKCVKVRDELKANKFTIEFCNFYKDSMEAIHEMYPLNSGEVH